MHASSMGEEVVPVPRPRLRLAAVAAVALLSCSGVTAKRADAAAHPDVDRLAVSSAHDVLPVPDPGDRVARRRSRLRLVDPADGEPVVVLLDPELVAELLAADGDDPDLFEDVAYQIARQLVAQLR